MSEDKKKPARNTTGAKKVEAVAKPLERVEPLNDAHLMESHRQCPAMSKRTGERCKRFCALGQRTCRWHGSATRVAKTAAAKRIAQASGYAADMLVEFMADPEIEVQLRTRIAQDLLDRSGVNTKTIMELQPKPMPLFEQLLLRTVVDVHGDGSTTPAYEQDAKGGWKAVGPGAISSEIHMDLVMDDEDILDAEVVDDDAYTPLTPRDPNVVPPAQTRADRNFEAVIERGRRAEVQRMRSGGMSEDERKRREAEAFAETATVKSTDSRGRAAWLAALDAGATHADAERAGRAAVEGADNGGKRRSRVSNATMTQRRSER